MNKGIFIASTLICFFIVSSAYPGMSGEPLQTGNKKVTVENYDLDNFPPGSDPKEIGIKLTERYIRTIDTQNPRVNYPYVCTWLGAFRFTQTIKDDNLYNRLLERYDNLFFSRGAENLIPPPNHVDNNVFGSVSLEVYKTKKEDKYLKMGLRYADTQWQLPADPRMSEKKWHDQGYSWQTRIWIDDMFMITTVQSQAYQVTGDRKYIDRTAREMALYLDRIQRPNGLFYHTPDVPFFWGRGNGWMAVGMADLLKVLPQDNPYRERIEKAYRLMMETLLRYQAEDGMWRQLIDDEASWKETSSSAMFTYAMIIGVKNGWLDQKTYGTAARKGWLALLTYLDDDDNIRKVCEGTNALNNYQYYLDRKQNTGDLHGQAPLLWCADALISSSNHQKGEQHTKAGKVNSLPEWTLGGFQRPSGVNPVISPLVTTKFYCPMQKENVNWEESDTFNPAAVVKGNNICVLYRAEDNSGKGIGRRTSRIGLAESTDGIHMKRRSTPVMFPDEDFMKKYEWPGGCEDPRVAVTEDGLYVMAYTSWNRDKARLCIATSRDLITWEKHGPAFEDAYQGRFLDIHCKAGSMVTEIKEDKQVITKVNGTYFMYWGEHRVWAATSENLTDWKPVLDEKGELKTVIAPRRGYFDSALTECGPPAIKTDKGILLLYNGKNQTNDERRDLRFNAGTYSAGQVLMDINDPMKVIGRLDVPFFRPMEDFEKSGQYVDGTVFIEGLVYFKGKWYLYYGCADSQVSVAIYDPAKKIPGDILPQ